MSPCNPQRKLDKSGKDVQVGLRLVRNISVFSIKEHKSTISKSLLGSESDLQVARDDAAQRTDAEADARPRAPLLAQGLLQHLAAKEPCKYDIYSARQKLCCQVCMEAFVEVPSS